ncbi:lipopolysaccharide biosynthesis protein [Trichococcus ilyis]|uniref:Membrane protein involved in the export of O-antigen and teichoic acid n=1 Tax=Trichococcus ilyis TaxID=640938 RepID=A0A143YQ97_9LACT|nr:hypothetical protein [Trichococcus ilyis]CZQ95806.1 polysaccharide biosynthesis protein [Trichococcus ilyis]SEJ05795.1 Membrane protein involved in the export of O-antigen and teichoic acid [Trichococcus ilyis]
MEFNKTKSTSKTFIFGLLSRMISILFPFITRTIIIHKLSSEYLGLTSLFTSVLTILNVSELGIGSAISFCLYKPIAENDKDTINALLNLMRKVYKIIGTFIFASGIAIMPFLKYFISGSYPEDINIHLLFLMYLVNAAVSYLGFAYKGALFEAYQEGSIVHQITAVVEIIKYILQITILIVLRNYYWFALMLPLSTICNTIVTEKRSRQVHPDLVPRGHVSLENKKIIKNKVFFLAAHSIAATLTNSIDTIVISGTLGLVATAIYGNYFYVFSSITTILVIAYRALKPAIGNILYTASLENLNKTYEGIQLLFIWMTTWCAISLQCLFNPFMKIWVGSDNVLSITCVLIIVFYFWGNSVKLFLSNTFIEAAGLWNKTLFRQIIAATLNLILDIVLVKKFGITGIVFASFFATTIIALPLDIHVACKYVLKRNTFFEIMRILGYFAFALTIGGITFFLCEIIPLSGLSEFAVRGIVCVIIPNVAFCLFFWKTESFKYIKTRLLGMILKNKAFRYDIKKARN